LAPERAALGGGVAAWAFAAAHGRQRRVFAKAAAEPKPFYVDFDSPVLLDVLTRQLRRSQSVVISEMLPEPSSCWLRDATGHRYTSELRVAVCDPVAWSPALLD